MSLPDREKMALWLAARLPLGLWLWAGGCGMWLCIVAVFAKPGLFRGQRVPGGLYASAVVQDGAVPGWALLCLMDRVPVNEHSVVPWAGWCRGWPVWGSCDLVLRRSQRLKMVALCPMAPCLAWRVVFEAVSDRKTACRSQRRV